MNEKKYTILISGIACLLAIVLTLCSVVVSRASGSDDLHHLVYDSKTSSSSFKDESGVGNYADSEHPVFDAEFSETEKNTYPKSSCFKTYYKALSTIHDRSIRIGWEATGEMPVLVFVLSATQMDLDLSGYSSSFLGKSFFAMVGNSKFRYKVTDYYMSTKKDADGNEYPDPIYADVNYNNYDGTIKRTSKHDIESYYLNCSSVLGSSTVDIDSGDFNCFTSMQDALDYLQTGDTSKIAFGKDSSSSQEYDSGLLLNDFDVQFHDSNKFEECYLDVKYTIPDNLKGVSSFQIDMEEKFDWCGHFSGSVSDLEETHTGTNYIDVLNHADGFRIYLKDIKAIDNFVDQYDGFFNATHKRQVLGSFTGLNIPFGDYLLGNVKVSCLDVKFHLVANKKYGHYVDYNLNLLTGIGVKNSYVPDSDGNYTSNNDSKVNGHYYTDVSTDATGNTTYNYYYYYPDGGKEKVSSEDAANNTITNTVQEGAIKIDNNPAFTNNNNITIEGDTVSNSANSYADSKSDATTNKSFIDKFLGFFEIIENNSFLGVFGKIFGWLPTGISSLVTTALGIIVGIRVFKAFR